MVKFVTAFALPAALFRFAPDGLLVMGDVGLRQHDAGRHPDGIQPTPLEGWLSRKGTAWDGKTSLLSGTCAYALMSVELAWVRLYSALWKYGGVTAHVGSSK